MDTLFKVVTLDANINYDSSHYEIEMDRERQLNDHDTIKTKQERHTVDPDALDCKSYLQEYRTGMRRSLLPVIAMGYKALSYRA